MQPDEAAQKQPSPVAPSGSSNWRRIAIVVVITGLLAGIGGYMLGVNTHQSGSQSKSRALLKQTAVNTSLSPTTTLAPTTRILEKENTWERDPGVSLVYPENWYDEKYLINGIKPHMGWKDVKAISLINDGSVRYGGNGGIERYPSRFIAITALETAQTPMEFLNDVVAHFEPSAQEEIRRDMHIQDYNLNGISAKIYDEPGLGSRGTMIVVSNGKELYFLNIATKNPEDDTILNQILSSFKFIE